jgi:aromatic-L-amino-acid decarboxylase
MLKKLKELETISRKLEPSASERKKAQKEVIKYTEAFLEDIEKSKAYKVTKDNGMNLPGSTITENPKNIKHLLHLIRTDVDTPGINPASGGHLGYIAGGGLYYAALADYMAAITNRYAGVFFASPGAVRMENMLIAWVCKLMSYPKNAAGNLTSGGSMANLVAITTARDAMKIKSTNIRRSVIYLSKQTHHSVDKAIRIAGLGECITRYLPLDNGYKIIPEEFAKIIKKDKADGLNPFLVIASAGTTDTGAIDPLLAIGEIANKNKLWYHIDAAYGGFFMLTPEGKKKLKGIELSDSLIIDPHKSLFLPYGSGIVIVKDRKKLQDSFNYSANYMQDTIHSNEELSPSDLSPELSKHFRGLRMWLPLKLHGTKLFKVCLQEKLLLAKYFYDEIQKAGFEAGPAPELSVVTYRYIPENNLPKKSAAREAYINKFNERLLNEVQNDGRIFISSTMLDSKFILRLAALSFRTHKSHIDLLLKILKEKVKILEEVNANS